MTITIAREMETITPRDTSGRPDWLKQRRSGIGGSEISAILGLSTEKTPYDIWLDKLGRKPEAEPNEAMLAGVYNEPVAAQRYADRNRATLVKGGFIRSLDHPFLVGTPDYIDTTNNILVEIKCPASWTIKSWNGELPIMYWAQMQHYMFLTGMKSAKLVTYADGRYYKEWPVAYDEAWYMQAIHQLHEWWTVHIVGLEPPARTPETPEADADADAVEADAAITAAYRELLQMRTLEDQIQERKDALETIIGNAMGSATVLKIDGKVAVTWKASDVRRFDSKALKSADPETYDKYVRTSTIRTFRVKEID